MHDEVSEVLALEGHCMTCSLDQETRWACQLKKTYKKTALLCRFFGNYLDRTPR